jgi:hypothetical protein
VLTFFGLTHNYRANLFIQIHEIVFHGNGGYDWETIYNMPIWLRTLTYRKISDFYSSKNKPKETVEESIEAMKSVGATPNSKVNIPSYVTKASKK